MKINVNETGLDWDEYIKEHGKSCIACGKLCVTGFDDDPVCLDCLEDDKHRDSQLLRFRDARAYARKLRRRNTPTHRIHETIRDIWGEDIEQLVIKTGDNGYYLPSDRTPERPVWDILMKPEGDN